MQPVAYQFEGFELLPSRRALRRGGAEVSVTPRAFDLLVALVERAGELVSKNELLQLVWPKVVVEENNLQVQISVLRKLLGPHAISTVPGHGYTFTLLHDAVPPGRSEPGSRDQTSSRRAPGNLPAQLPPLYGRSEDLKALGRLLEQHRLVSLVGPAGIGKTRVAQAVAHASHGSYADGVCLVELAPLTDPLLVVSTVARALGHAVAKDDAALSSLVAVLREQRLLLVLDNCEHVLPAIVELATKILAGTTQVRLLVTSQEPLHLGEERIDRLNALAVPAAASGVAAASSYGAVELFVARAQAADPRFVLTPENTEAVVEICRRLDGIPLAIELAAGRVLLLGVLGLRQRLDERLKLLAGGVRTALARHQTLRAALEWSHALLTAEDRTVFDRLGVFVGSFSMQAAQQLASDEAIDEWAVLDHLAALVDKSLVLVEAGSVPRYRLLESSRAFALERLAAGGMLDTLRRRHAQVMADTLVGDDPMEGPNARMLRVSPDLDNVRAAAVWATGIHGDRQIAIALAGASDMVWDAQACSDEGERLYGIVEPWVDASTPPLLAARYWFAVSNMRLHVGMKRQAQAGLEAAKLFRCLGDRYWRFRSLLSASWKLSHLGDPVAAQAPLAEAQELLDPSWPLWTRAAIEHGHAQRAYFAQQRLGDARGHCDAVLDLHRRFGGDGYYVQVCEMVLVCIENDEGHFETAVRRAQDVIDGLGTALSAKFRSMFLIWQGTALTALGRLQEAEALFRAGVPQLKHAIGSAQWAFYYVAYFLALERRMDDAARVIGYLENPNAPPTLSTATKRRCHHEARAMVAAALRDDEFDRLLAEGCALTEDEAVSVAFPPRP
jgi:predicted ATPase/DNA-binding winged helix-turn-helix (wHTH) protein